MNDNRFNGRVPLAVIYQKFIILFVTILIIGNTCHIEPPYYILLAISFFAVFFSSRIIDTFFIRQYLFILIFSIYGILDATIVGGGYGGPLTIITGLMVLYAAQNIKFDKCDIIILVMAMLISIGYWLYRSPTYYSEFFYNQWKGDNTYTNSNGVGHYLAYECSYMFMILSLSNRRKAKCVKWILAGICLWGCLNVKARMASITLIMFLLINIVLNRWKNNRKGIIKALLFFSIALEIIFPIIYLMLYKHRIGLNIKFFGLAEKGLYSGRQDIWLKTFDAIQTVPDMLFGIGSKHDFWKTGLLNMHNNAMNLLVVVGLVGLLIYFGYLIAYINRRFDFENASELQWQCLIFFICILIEGTTDITIFYNNFLAFYFLPLGIALNCNYSKLELDNR